MTTHQGSLTMAQYAVTEQANGDLTIHLPQGNYAIVAQRGQPATEARVVAAEVSLYTSQYQEEMVQVSCLLYQWPDSYEKWGGYLGYCFRLIHA